MLLSAAFFERLAGAIVASGVHWAAAAGTDRRLYLLVARKLMIGLRPLRQERRERMGKLLPMPVAKISRRDAEHHRLP